MLNELKNAKVATAASSATEKNSRLDPDERRRELLVFGQDYFAHNRFDSLSMNELAKRAGVSKGLLYHYFGNRRGYYLSTMSFTIDKIIEVVGVRSDHDSRSLRELLLDLTDYFATTKYFYVMSTLSGDADVRNEIERARAVIIARVLELRAMTVNSAIGATVIRGWQVFCESAIFDWLTSDTISQTLLVDTLLYQLDCVLAMPKDSDQATGSEPFIKSEPFLNIR